MSHNNPSALHTSAGPLRVAIVSDDPELRGFLAEAFGDQLSLGTDAEASDVVLWDSGASGLGLGARLDEVGRFDRPTVALLPDASQAQRVIEAGARGVMLRSQVGAPLLSALRAVSGGLTVLDASLAPGLLSDSTAQGLPPLAEPLTTREHEVLRLLADGLSNRQVASALDISEHTAKFHIGRILDKLDAETRTEAVVRALRYGLLTL